MADQAVLASKPSLGGTALAARFLQAAQKLAEPYRTLFQRIYCDGESEEVIKASLKISDDLYKTRVSEMLRALKAASAAPEFAQ